MIYKYLWLYNKLRAGHIRSESGVFKVECKGCWWGLGVFNLLRKHLSANCVAVIQESPEVRSLLVIQDSLLRVYESYDPARFHHFYNTSSGVDTFSIGLSDAESSQLKCNPLQVKEMHGYRSIEELVAHSVLLPNTRYDRVLIGVALILGCLSVNLCSWVCYCSRLEKDLQSIKLESQQLENHPLVRAKAPVPIPWHKVLSALESTRYVSIKIHGNKIIIHTPEYRRTVQILKRLGFVHNHNPTDLCHTEQIVEATYKPVRPS
jgi:hypothetical protein